MTHPVLKVDNNNITSNNQATTGDETYVRRLDDVRIPPSWTVREPSRKLINQNISQLHNPYPTPFVQINLSKTPMATWTLLLQTFGFLFRANWREREILLRYSSSHDGKLSLCIGTLATDHLGNLDSGHCSDVLIINGNKLVTNLKLVSDATGVLDSMDDGSTLVGGINDNAELSGRGIDFDHLFPHADVLASIVLFEAGIIGEDGGTASGSNSGGGGSSESTASTGLLTESSARRGDDRSLSASAVGLGIVIVDRCNRLVAITSELLARLGPTWTRRLG